MPIEVLLEVDRELLLCLWLAHQNRLHQRDKPRPVEGGFHDIEVDLSPILDGFQALNLGVGTRSATNPVSSNIR